jgi:hypothetical protein
LILKDPLAIYLTKNKNTILLIIKPFKLVKTFKKRNKIRNHTFFLDCPYFKHTCVVGSIKKHLGLSHGYENCKRTCTDKSRKYKVVIVIKYPAKSYIIASTH